MKKIAVVLAGCGVFDGAEIHEAVMSLYAIAKHGCTYEIFAPDILQHHVINHITGNEMNEKRNVLVEAARIARGKIKPLSQFSASNFDALLFPGGFGVAKNLSSFAFDGANCKVNAHVEKVVKEMVEAKKPIGALCIAPAIMAKILKDAKVTIGNDEGTANQIIKTGSTHVITKHKEVCIDKNYKLVTSPCYMLDSTIIDIAEDADLTVKSMIELMQ